MAEQGTSAPTEIATSETPALPEPLSLDDLSPAQAQRALEAALQHYRVGDESRVVDAGTSAAVPSLTNAGLTTPLTASGEQQRGQISLIYVDLDSILAPDFQEQLRFSIRPHASFFRHL